jgi:hypothetical protein
MFTKKILPVLFSAILGLATLAPAAPASATTCTVGGSGSAGDPYIICDEASFEGMANHKTSHYKLGADIDLATRSVSSFDFNGELNGDGHTINNYTATFSGGAYQGLFTVLNSSSNIHDLQMKDVNITVSDNGSPYIGPLGGRLLGTVARVQISGNMTTGSTYTAGLVGLMFSGGNITDSVSSVNITAVGDVTYNSGITAALLDTGGGLPSLNRVIYTGQHSGQWSFAGLYVTQGDGECNAFTQSYAITQTASSAINSLCNSYKSRTELGRANGSTEGFSGFSSNVWSFGDDSSLPYLAQFPHAPSRPKAIGAFALNGSLWANVIAGYDGGSIVTGFEVQYRGSGEVWSSDGVSLSFSNTYIINGLEPGIRYEFRARALSAAGNSEWTYSLGTASLGATGYRISNPVLLSPVQSSVRMTEPLLDSRGNVAIARSIMIDGVSQIDIDYYDRFGNILSTTTPDVSSAPVSNGEDGEVKLVNLSNGEIGVFWISKIQPAGSPSSSKIRFSHGLPDQSWSTPIDVSQTFTYNGSVDDCDWSGCALNGLQAVATATGGLVVTAIKQAPVSSLDELYAYSSKTGVTWTVQTAPISASATIRPPSLAATTAGAVVSWAGQEGNSYFVRYSLLKVAGGTWSGSKLFTSASTAMYGNVVSRGGNKVAISAYVQRPVSKAITRDLDGVKDKWLSKEVTMFTTTGYPQEFDMVAAPNGDLLGLFKVLETDLSSSIYYVKVPAGAKLAKSPIQVATSSASTIDDIAIKSSVNGSPLISWLQKREESARTWSNYVAAGVGATLSQPVLIPTTTGYVNESGSLLLADGTLNFYSMAISGNSQTGLEQVSVQLGTIPQVSIPAISGIAKVGKLLTAAPVTSASFNRVPVVSYQWYTCTDAVASVDTQVSSDCTPIAKATKATFKPSKALRGRFIAYSVRSTNGTGTSLVFSPSTLRVE